LKQNEAKYWRSFPGNNGLPSNISAKMQPALHMSTRYGGEKNEKTALVTLVPNQSITQIRQNLKMIMMLEKH
jgi:hypothetical protein